MKIDRQRFFSLALSCNHIAVVCLVALALSLAGCTKSRTEPYLALESASIEGPDGRIELETRPKRSKGRTPRWSLDMRMPAVNNEVQLTFVPFSNPDATLYITRPVGRSGPSFEVVEILYQLNDGSELTLEPTRIREREGNRGRSRVILEFMRPGNLVDVIHRAHGPHLTSMFETIRQQDGDIHRFYVNFIMNDEPHVLDASFELKLDTVRYSNAGSFGGLP